jgi:hypothetical protein
LQGRASTVRAAALCGGGPHVHCGASVPIEASARASVGGRHAGRGGVVCGFAAVPRAAQRWRRGRAVRGLRRSSPSLRSGLLATAQPCQTNMWCARSCTPTAAGSPALRRLLRETHSGFYLGMAPSRPIKGRGGRESSTSLFAKQERRRATTPAADGGHAVWHHLERRYRWHVDP